MEQGIAVGHRQRGAVSLADGLRGGVSTALLSALAVDESLPCLNNLS